MMKNFRVNFIVNIIPIKAYVFFFRSVRALSWVHVSQAGEQLRKGGKLLLTALWALPEFDANGNVTH